VQNCYHAQFLLWVNLVLPPGYPHWVEVFLFVFSLLHIQPQSIAFLFNFIRVYVRLFTNLKQVKPLGAQPLAHGVMKIRLVWEMQTPCQCHESVANVKPGELIASLNWNHEADRKLSSLFYVFLDRIPAKPPSQSCHQTAEPVHHKFAEVSIHSEVWNDDAEDASEEPLCQADRISATEEAGHQICTDALIEKAIFTPTTGSAPGLCLTRLLIQSLVPGIFAYCYKTALIHPLPKPNSMYYLSAFTCWRNHGMFGDLEPQWGRLLAPEPIWMWFPSFGQRSNAHSFAGVYVDISKAYNPNVVLLNLNDIGVTGAL